MEALMSAVKYWIWLASRYGVGRRSVKRILEKFSDAENIYFARESDYRDIGLAPAEMRSLTDKDLSPARKIIETCGKLNIGILTYGDPLYPERLKNIFDPPAVLYYRGVMPVIDEEPVVGMVGTRKCTEYGYRTAERIGYEYARLGGVVATGLAKGVDTAAAKGALLAGGTVIGVIGCGLDTVYPPENAGLFCDVARSGVIISEFVPGTPPRRQNFPQRNRIISGISVGTTVIEAPDSSGALITAEAALEQGRDVFAVPGNVDTKSCVGSNKLLREGAAALMSGRDLVEVYIGQFPDKLSLVKNAEPMALEGKMSENEIKCGEKCPEQYEKEIDKDEIMEYIDLMTARGALSEDETAVLRAISNETAHIDEIIEKTGLRAGSALAALTILEIKGIVSQSEGKKFSFTPLK